MQYQNMFYMYYSVLYVYVSVWHKIGILLFSSFTTESRALTLANTKQFLPGISDSQACNRAFMISCQIFFLDKQMERKSEQCVTKTFILLIHPAFSTSLLSLFALYWWPSKLYWFSTLNWLHKWKWCLIVSALLRTSCTNHSPWVSGMLGE